MQKLVAVLLLVTITALSSGCAVIGDRREAAACQVADGVTTYAALKAGAVEANPLLASASPAAILLIKFAFAYVIWKAIPKYEEANKAERFAAGAMTVLGCVPALNNYNVYKGL